MSNQNAREPNESKLSDDAVRRDGCTLNKQENVTKLADAPLQKAASVTHGGIRWSAWLSIVFWVLFADTIIRATTLKPGPLSYVMEKYPMTGFVYLVLVASLGGKILQFLWTYLKNQYSGNMNKHPHKYN